MMCRALVHTVKGTAQNPLFWQRLLFCSATSGLIVTCILIAVLITLFNAEKNVYTLSLIVLLYLVLEEKQYSVKIADLIDSELSCVIGFATKLNY